MEGDPDISDGLRRLRSNHAALLLVDEVYTACRYVVCNTTGRPVMPMPALWHAAKKSGRLDPLEPIAMFVPEDCEGCLQLLVVPDPLDARTDPAADRYMAYHGKPTEAVMARLNIDTAKWPGEVCDGAQISVPNPLGSDEPRLCKVLNSDPVRLADLCERALGARPESAVAVGIDPGGLDVRVRFGINRVEFPNPMTDATSASAAIESLLASR